VSANLAREVSPHVKVFTSVVRVSPSVLLTVTLRPLSWGSILESASVSTGRGSGMRMDGNGADGGGGSHNSEAADAPPSRTFLPWLSSSALISLPPPLSPADLRSSCPIHGGVRTPASLLGQHITHSVPTVPRADDWLEW
jgi:hypothetical protein